MSTGKFGDLGMSPGTPIPGRVVKSAKRTFEILEFFVEHRRPANLLTIAEVLGYPPSSTAAIVKTLAMLGYLHHDAGTRTYFPTSRISLLGGWLRDQYFSDNFTLELMNSVALDTRQTVILAMQSGIHVQYLIVIKGDPSLRAYARMGSLRPICRAATGKMLLTLVGEPAVRGIVNHANSLETEPENRVSYKDLVAELKVCRKTGHAITRGQVTPGVGTVATLLPAGTNHVPLAIAVGGPVETLDAEWERWLAVLRERIGEFTRGR